MEANGDLVVFVKGSDDTLTIKNFSSDLYLFEFANGVMGTIDEDTVRFTETTLK